MRMLVLNAQVTAPLLFFFFFTFPALTPFCFLLDLIRRLMEEPGCQCKAWEVQSRTPVHLQSAASTSNTEARNPTAL